ncbi:MAG: CDC27 family protein [Saprospiraceae bacterium]|nr:CDC27 family protein [Saprospiraceae bacterium]
MNKKMHFTIVLLLCFGCLSVVAQKQVYKAKLQYDMGQYSLAKEGIQDYLADFPADMEAHLLLAKCHYALGKWNDCINRVEKIIHLTNIPADVHELYGKVLKQVGRFEEAKKHFEIFALQNREKGSLHIKSAEFAMEAMARESKYDIISLPYNSSTSDFGLTFYQNVPVFSSFRTDILMDEMQKTSNAYNGVQKSFFYSNKKHHFIKGLNNKLDGIGPLSFSSNGEYCAMIESYMTVDCNIRCEKNNGVLYLAKISKTGDITENHAFVHNEAGSSIHSAHIAYDGKALYFSSDRPGGFGGFDLYVSYKKNNFWSLPENLGPEINTSGNELTPYYNNGELLFASDLLPGFGGYDIFQSKVENGNWSLVKNMEYGINSIGDDYFPVFNSKGEMFITSNRLGGKGEHDIYKAIKVVNDEEPLLSAVEVDLIPPAVSLESLEDKHAKNPQSNTKTVALKSNEAVKTNSVFVLPEFDRKEIGMPAAEFSLDGARRIAMGNIAPTGEVFFIQLASVTHLEPNISKFSPLVRYGNIYK